MLAVAAGDYTPMNNTLARLVKIVFGIMSVLMLTFCGLVLWSGMTGRIPFGASFAANYGVVVGMIAIAGMSFARMFFRIGRGPLGLLFIAMTGLFAVMKWQGEFGEQVFGPFSKWLDFGFIIGIAWGAAGVALLFIDEKDQSQ
jgi:hypothetical protein